MSWYGAGMEAYLKDVKKLKKKMNIIKINKEHYIQINATTWECKHSDCKNKWINLRDGGSKNDYWGFCDDDGVDWQVEWFNPI